MDSLILSTTCLFHNSVALDPMSTLTKDCAAFMICVFQESFTKISCINMDSFQQ
jgi:hypothetical protein